MSRKTRNLGAAGLFAACAAVALAVLPALLHGKVARDSSRPQKLVVHEWGTFTSFAGSDGVNLEFRPLVTNDLPRFIMTPYNQLGSKASIWENLSKSRFVAFQRMETPVTYFYTDVPRVVNVRVDFPEGMLSEWYPVVKDFGSGKNDKDQTIVGKAFLDWGPVRLTPPEQFSDIRVRGRNGAAVPAALPPVKADNHYGHARETDSAIVETVDVNRGSHFEKFLFYRGLGNFELPIKLSALGNDRFEVANESDDASGAMLLVRIENDIVRFTRMDPINPYAAVEIVLPEYASSIDRLVEATIRELIAAGLYEKEAVAMVNTWRTSWFGENGTRLMYLVPGKLTDELLPLKVDPTPEEMLRVLVGRLETLTPEDSQRLVQEIAGNASEEQPSGEAVKAALAPLGRFAEPAIQFVLGQTSDTTIRSRLVAILADIRGKQ
jgi:hypothetical protein